MDEAFHVAVAQASHNRVLAKMVMTLHHQTARFWLNTMREPSLEENRQALAEHRDLVSGEVLSVNMQPALARLGAVQSVVGPPRVLVVASYRQAAAPR